MAIEIQIRRDTAANWTSVDPTLAEGEFGLETDTNQLKIGDGVLAWTALAYFGGSANPFDQDLNTTDAVVFAGLTNNAIIYPTSDGTAGQSIVTDGAGNLSFASSSGGVSSIIAGTGISVDSATGDVTVTNSLSSSGGTISGSLIVTGSVSCTELFNADIDGGIF
jgi:Major tropism determinant N-terminal domain